ncbi:Uncharacterised protein [Vibrio cholerae]|uniref:Uncharacterized protein n=1 Tax=Vibrio cholerae TaxID=666 RepID=A0A656A495_VIBCL|nr:Uncharacterised protein [Vibrio cholerae]CSC02117.1 Uncharacterised protein [Vibrio cholerae]CSC39887.1 Uncharacterised protein [Vibrio cholerae]CSC95528.1 Uncharacterised protein [Vibrio cholerae]
MPQQLFGFAGFYGDCAAAVVFMVTHLTHHFTVFQLLHGGANRKFVIDFACVHHHKLNHIVRLNGDVFFECDLHVITQNDVHHFVCFRPRCGHAYIRHAFHTHHLRMIHRHRPVIHF